MKAKFICFAVPEDLLRNMRCPTCSNAVQERELIDPYIRGIICQSGHRFFLPCQMVDSTYSREAAALPPVGSSELHEVAKTWLSSAEYRSRLNDQIAVALRRIYEFEVLGERIPWKSNLEIFAFCPICSEALHPAEPDFSTWAEIMKCDNGHEYAVRGGAWFHHGTGQVCIADELSDKDTAGVCKAWLNNHNPVAACNLHEDIRNVFAKFVSSPSDVAQA